jgi:hypothetical protein
MIEEVAGRSMSDEERHEAMMALSQKLRDWAVDRASIGLHGSSRQDKG